MKTVLFSLVGTVALGAMAGGCAQKRTPPLAHKAAPRTVAPPATLPSLADEQAPLADSKEKRPRFGEAAIYIDGKSVGVMRATELPPALKGRAVNIGGGYATTRYGFVDYVRALGIDAKRIKALHLYGGSRVVVVDKAEVARIGDGIMFSFVQGDRGKPRVHWPPVKLHVNSTIDMVSNVAVYVEKEPPVLDARGELVMPNGAVVEGKVPYAPEEQGNGTRVYVDGNLVGTVKRKKLTNDMLVTDLAGKGGESNTAAAKTEAATDKAGADKGGEDRFSLLAYAVKLRPDAKQAKSIDLVAGDDVIAHVSPDQARLLTFNVPPRNRGQAVVDISVDGAARRARVSAVQIYVSSTPSARPVVSIDAAPEAAIRSAPGGSGSDEDR
jgi:hypothetical protein